MFKRECKRIFDAKTFLFVFICITIASFVASLFVGVSYTKETPPALHTNAEFNELVVVIMNQEFPIPQLGEMKTDFKTFAETKRTFTESLVNFDDERIAENYATMRNSFNDFIASYDAVKNTRYTWLTTTATRAQVSENIEELRTLLAPISQENYYNFSRELSALWEEYDIQKAISDIKSTYLSAAQIASLKEKTAEAQSYISRYSGNANAVNFAYLYLSNAYAFEVSSAIDGRLKDYVGFENFTASRAKNNAAVYGHIVKNGLNPDKTGAPFAFGDLYKSGRVDILAWVASSAMLGLIAVFAVAIFLAIKLFNRSIYPSSKKLLLTRYCVASIITLLSLSALVIILLMSSSVGLNAIMITATSVVNVFTYTFALPTIVYALLVALSLFVFVMFFFNIAAAVAIKTKKDKPTIIITSIIIAILTAVNVIFRLESNIFFYEFAALFVINLVLFLTNLKSYKSRS